MRSAWRMASLAAGSMEPDSDSILPIMRSTGSEGNMRGMKNMKVTPIRIVSAHVTRRRPRYFQNFTGYTPSRLIVKPAVMRSSTRADWVGAGQRL